MNQKLSHRAQTSVSQPRSWITVGSSRWIAFTSPFGRNVRRAKSAAIQTAIRLQAKIHNVSRRARIRASIGPRGTVSRMHRALDVAIAGTGLVVSSPLLALGALAVKLE